MSNKVVKLDTVQHKYEIEECAGCHKPITGEYTEIGLPSANGLEIKHIALCDSCSNVAENEGIL